MGLARFGRPVFLEPTTPLEDVQLLPNLNNDQLTAFTIFVLVDEVLAVKLRLLSTFITQLA